MTRRKPRRRGRKPWGSKGEVKRFMARCRAMKARERVLDLSADDDQVEVESKQIRGEWVHLHPTCGTVVGLTRFDEVPREDPCLVMGRGVDIHLDAIESVTEGTKRHFGS